VLITGVSPSVAVHLCPVLPRAVYVFVYAVVLICVHTNEIRDYRTKRSTFASLKTVNHLYIIQQLSLKMEFTLYTLYSNMYIALQAIGDKAFRL
jgi:hypothetical protein